MAFEQIIAPAPGPETWPQDNTLPGTGLWSRTEDFRNFRYLPAIRLTDAMSMADTLTGVADREAIRQLEAEYGLVTALTTSINEKTRSAFGAYSFFERQPAETVHVFFHPLDNYIREAEHTLRSTSISTYQRSLEHMTGLIVEHVRTALQSVQPEIELIPAIALSGMDDTSPVTDAAYRKAEQKFHRLVVDEKLGHPAAAHELNVYRAQAAFIETYGASSILSIRKRWETQVTTEPHISMAVAEILQDPPDVAFEKIEILLGILNRVLMQIPNVLKREDYPTEADWKRAISRKEDELRYFRQDFYVDIEMTFAESNLRELYIRFFRADLRFRYVQSHLQAPESPIS